jgi:asparagine synthetase B (glutamine-hydrolysing)
MPVLAGWITGEQVPYEIIEQTLRTMEEVLARHGGTPARTIQPGAGLVSFADPAYAQLASKEHPVLDWVPERRTLVYRRPLSGMHPLFYIENWPAQGNLLFASEIKALLALGMPRRWHLPALDALLRYGFIPAPWTAFKDIFVVPAGSILRWQHSKTIVNHASDFTIETAPTPIPTVDQIADTLNEASTNQLPPHEHIIALSGGSRAAALATALAARNTQNEFPIVTLGTTKTLRTKGWQEVERLVTTCNLPQLAITGRDEPEFWIATLAGLESPCSDTRPLALHQLFHTTAAETGARVAITGLGASTLLNFQGMRQPQAERGSMHPSSKQQSAESILQSYSDLQNRSTTGISNDLVWTADAQEVLKNAEPWETTLHARKLARKAEQFTQRELFQYPQTDLGYYYLDLHLRLPDMLVQPCQQLAQQERIAIRSLYLQPQIMESLTRYAPILTANPSQWQIITDLLHRYIPALPEHPIQLPLSIPQPALSSNKEQDTTDLVEQMLSPAALKKVGLFQTQAVQELRARVTKKSVPPALLTIFTTQLLTEIFQIEAP